MLKDRIAGFIDRIRTIEGVTACAVVSRDGVVAGKSFDRDLNVAWFCALMATVLASAESAANIIRMHSMDLVTIRGSDTTIMVVGAGDNFLVTSILNNRTGSGQISDKILSIAKNIGEVK
ncbi:MAG: Roadblock/LC7 domain protein [Methanoregula sp. PtaU1.Bin051]|nr:MAG: Roadblock/LC7 domain protein [Methanoregula sp. PtaU1.Bin051]